MISEGFSLKPLVTLYVWTGRGETLERVELPGSVTVRRYTVGDRREAEARLIGLVMSKIETAEEEMPISERYYTEYLIPVFCHFLMVLRPSLMVRVRRMLGLTDYSGRAMGKLLVKGRLDIRELLNDISMLVLHTEWFTFEKSIIDAVVLNKGKKPNSARDDAQEADFFYGLVAHFNLSLDEIRNMTYSEIGRLCDAAERAGKKSKQPRGDAKSRYEAKRREMGY